jgi:hypothetical protein
MEVTTRMLKRKTIIRTGALALFMLPLTGADHRDAPAINGIPEGDITDIYAFLDPQNRGRLILIMGVNPLSVPGFTHSYRFAKDYLYQFKLDLNGDYNEDMVIQARFRDTPDTGQIMRVHTGFPNPAHVGVSNLFLEDAPSQVETPVGRVFGDPNDIQVFAGLRDDPFVLDGQVFRILNGSQDVFREIPASPLGPLRGRPVRANGASGVDVLGGFNASFIAVGIPVGWLGGTRDIINIWGTVSSPATEAGFFQQFERSGQPLFNTVFVPGPLKDAFNVSVPADDVTRWGRYVPDALTTTDNDGTGNTIAGRHGLLTTLGLDGPPFGAPLLLPANFANTNKDLIRAAVVPDVIRLNLKLDPNDLAIGQFGLTNGRRVDDDVVDIAFGLIRQLADVNFPAALRVPGSGTARAGALNSTDRRVFAVLQGTDFIKPDSQLRDVTTSGNDKPIPNVFPFLPEAHPRPGDAGDIGFPRLQ